MAVDPAIEALFGPAPDNVDLTEGSWEENNGAVIAMLCLAVVAIILRFIARCILRNPFLADDWAILSALVGIAATTGISVAARRHRGRWQACVGSLPERPNVPVQSESTTPATYTRLTPQLLFSYTFIYALSCTGTRVSILFFYKRVFSPLEQSLKIAMAISGIITASYPIIVWVTMSTSCRPVSHFWTQFSGTAGTCIDINQFFLAAGIINMLNDFIILAIPFPRIAKLQMTLKKKAAVCGIMAVGIFVCVASIVRIHYLSVFMSATDLTWLMGPVFIWSTIEPSVAIVCACLPHFAPLARVAHRSISNSYSKSKSYGNSNSRAGLSSTKSRGRGGHGSGVQSLSARGGSMSMLGRGAGNKGVDVDEDEIGLTNYVTSMPRGGGSDAELEYGHGSVSQIRVESTFVTASVKGDS
ncbi:uncharacterized protein DSM5745_09315 [Aspergillus mulundensis]|uniref:Rhodopsin domain-containing protein n=1 Tax=Aspergillus mulundensis TaxID=1810919 RepID=A0A3D8R072_9EURO|nr:hypothetical protein DSM5745_09315 [Aspergillus mulundensis]RDW67449.1 hypothetical protein DSM5745_09315 [Aspergillus mulundensis]